MVRVTDGPQWHVHGKDEIELTVLIRPALTAVREGAGYSRLYS